MHGVLLPVSSRCLSPGSIVPLAPALVDGWIAGTSPAMTCGARMGVLHELPPRDLLQVAVIDLVAVGLGEVEAVEDLDGLADVAGAALGIEGAVGGEHHPVGAVELEAADGGRARAEHGGVGVEVLLEVVEWALLEALEEGEIVLVRGALAD